MYTSKDVAPSAACACMMLREACAALMQCSCCCGQSLQAEHAPCADIIADLREDCEDLRKEIKEMKMALEEVSSRSSMRGMH